MDIKRSFSQKKQKQINNIYESGRATHPLHNLQHKGCGLVCVYVCGRNKPRGQGATESDEI